VASVLPTDPWNTDVVCQILRRIGPDSVPFEVAQVLEIVLEVMRILED
jgi:hypothetical protein